MSKQAATKVVTNLVTKKSYFLGNKFYFADNYGRKKIFFMMTVSMTITKPTKNLSGERVDISHDRSVIFRGWLKLVKES